LKKIISFCFSYLIAIVVFGQVAVDCLRAEASANLAIDSIRLAITTSGMYWQNETWNSSYALISSEDISNYTKPTIEAGAIWLAAKDEAGGLHIAAQTTRQGGEEFWPGPIDNNTLSTNLVQCAIFDQIWSVRKETIEFFKLGLTLNDEQHEEIYNWPAKGNIHCDIQLPNQELAPFVDLNGDEIYNPDDGDYPKIKGDVASWLVINDIGNDHENTNGAPLGFEIQMMVFAFKNINLFKYSTFYEFKIINKSSNNYHDFLFGQWIFSTLGQWDDDYFGCDSTSATAFIYNADDFDEGASGFGENIPIQAVQFVTVPEQNYGTQNKMFSCIKYLSNFDANGFPQSADHFYNYLIGKWKNGNDITYGEIGNNVNNNPTKYMYSSNPALYTESNNWSECSELNEPENSRIVMSTGKYNFAAGETKTFILAAHTILDVPHPCPDIQPMIDLANTTASFFDNLVSTNDLINEGELSNEIKLFPNPVQNELSIKSSVKVKNIEIYNMNGQLIEEISINSSTTKIDLQELNNGHYLVKLNGQNQKEILKKITVVK